MSDLIRRSDVERWILTETASIDTPADRDAVVERMRYSIPTVDAVEVRHGRWIDKRGRNVALDEDDCPVSSAWCSECFDWLSASDEYAVRGRYCPNCGARMDGKDGDGDGG